MRFPMGRPRRGRARVGRPEALAGPLRARVAEAHRLWSAGRLAEAAQQLSDLAQEAGHDGLWRRAGQLHARAGEIFAQANDRERAQAEARAGLAWLRRLGGEEGAARLAARLIAGLRPDGTNPPAERPQESLRWDDDPGPAAPPPRGRLPVRCPECGGPLRSDEVEWIDAQSAECPYCGSTVLADPEKSGRPDGWKD